MSGVQRKRKTLKIDRNVLRDVRKKTHKSETRGIAGFSVALAAFVALGVILYAFRDSYQPSQGVRRSVKPNPDYAYSAPVEASPVEDESSPLAEHKVSTETVRIESGNVSTSTKVPLKKAVTVSKEEPRALIDHLSPELIQPSTRKVYLKIGRLDGHPENCDTPFDGEFGKETLPGKVARVHADRIRDKFPQRIMPGQSVVLNLHEMKSEDLLFRAVSVRRDKPRTMFDPTKAVPSLRILCNGNVIWGRRLVRQGFMINALIPASYLEAYKNTITLQNDGRLDVVFDALWIESAREASETVRFSIRDWKQIPADYRGVFAWCRERETDQMRRIPSSRDMLLRYPMKKFEEAARREDKFDSRCEGLWHYRNPFVAFNQQEKVVLHFLEKAIGWYFQGGSALTIENMTGPGQFFCTHTKRLYPSAYALWSLSRVFEGEAKRLPVNVLGGGGDEKPLDIVYWMATENQPGVASIIVAKSRFGNSPGKVRVVCALPWQGATVANVYNGVFPEVVNMDKPTTRAVFRGGERQDDPDGPYDRNRVDKIKHIQLTPNGQGGLLDIELKMQDCLYIRLVKQGAADMEQPGVNQYVLTKPLEKPVAINIAGGVSESRESSLLRRKRLPVFPGAMQSLCANYRVRTGEATRGTIAGQEYVVPDAAQSLFCDIDYTGGTPRTAEGAALTLNPFHESINGKALSFWVFTHTKTASRTVRLRMALGSWEGRATLKPGKWQRVNLQFTDIAGVPDRHLVFIGPSDYDKPGRADVITFEFNGITLVDSTGSGGKYINARPMANGRLAIVVLGMPGKEGSVRHNFPKAVAVKSVSNVGGEASENTLKWEYRKESQTLDVTGLLFPTTADDSVRKYLNYKEKELCRQRGLMPVVIIADIKT
jgi:hypothetical protein